MLVPAVSSGSADYLSTLSTRPLHSSRFTRHEVGTNSAILGKRIRISAWLKTKDVQVKAGAFLVIVNSEGHVFAVDPMTDRPINGTTDWNEIEMITDVPSEPCTIYLGATLYGPGEIWVDDFGIALAPPDKAITDDRIWHVWSPNTTDYSLTTDQQETHDGHATLCISYLPTDPAPPGSWVWWGQDIRNPDKYRGHTVRMTVWARSENIDGNVRPNLRPKGPYFKLLAQDKKIGEGLFDALRSGCCTQSSARFPRPLSVWIPDSLSMAAANCGSICSPSNTKSSTKRLRPEPGRSWFERRSGLRPAGCFALPSGRAPAA